MARVSVKATYSLDEETIRILEKLARQLRIPKSEVVRRAVRQLARLSPASGQSELEALDRLQSRLDLTTAEAEEWVGQVRQERYESGP